MKIERYSKLLWGVALFYTIFACSQQEDVKMEGGIGGPGGEWVPIDVEAGIDIGTQTRVATISNGSIGVYRTFPINGSSAQYNVKYTNAGSGWVAADTNNKILVGSESATLYAYYDPAGTAVAATNSTIVTIPQTAVAFNAAAPKAFFYATAPVSPVDNKNRVASFSMKPAQCMLTLNITRHAEYVNGNCCVSVVEMKTANNTNFNATTQVDISKAMNTQATTAVVGNFLYNVAADDAVFSGMNASTTKSLSILLPQHTTSVKRKLFLTIDGTVRSVEIASTGLYNAGMNYSVNLIIKDAAIIVNGNITVADYGTSITGTPAVPDQAI